MRPSLPARALARLALVPRTLWLRFAIFLLLVGAAAATVRWTPLADLLDREQLIAALEKVRGEWRVRWWAPVGLLGLYALLSPLGLPVSVLWIAGALVFGAVWGSVYNVLGTVLGGATSFYFARGFGRELVLHLVGDRLKPFEARLNRRGFWPLVGMRFLPVPYPVFNYLAALVGLRGSVFVGSTALGMVVPVVVWTIFWTAIAEAAAGDESARPTHVIYALVPFVLLIFLPRLWSGYQRRKRYRALREARGRR